MQNSKNNDEKVTPNKESFPVNNKEQTNKEAVQNKVDDFGTNTLKKMGVPEPAAQRAARTNGGPFSLGNLPLNKLMKNKAIGKIADSPLGDALNRNRSKNNMRSNRNDTQNNSQNTSQEDNNKNENSENEKLKNKSSEAIKDAAVKTMQTAGVPKTIADKTAEKVVDSPEGQKIIDDVIKKFKQKRREIFMQVFTIIAPYLLVFLIFITIIALIMTQIAAIVDKVEGALIIVSEGVEKCLNLMTGNGWNTEEEEFAITLQEQYEISLNYSETGIDVPLIAATINYNHVLNIYEEPESFSVKDLFGDFIEKEEVKNFYYVANDKLGTLQPEKTGDKRLIGHMMKLDVSFKRFGPSDACQHWKDFLEYFGLKPSVKDILKFLAAPGDFFNYLREMYAYSKQDGVSKIEYDALNIAYEFQEVLDVFENSGLKDLSFKDDEEFNLSKIIPAPIITLTYDEESYKDYLKEVYIPATYFADRSYKESEIDTIINEIFEQRESFYYLMGSSTANSDVESSKITVNVTNCDGLAVIESLSIKDFLYGALYAEADMNSSVEYLKALSIAIKNKLLYTSGSTIEKINKNIRVRSCDSEILYCSPSKGCSYAKTDFSNGLGSLISGSDTSGIYYKEPIQDANLIDKMNLVVDDTMNQVLIYDNDFVYTKYSDDCHDIICDSTTNTMDKSMAISMADGGSLYNDILKAFYNGELQEISLYSDFVFPLDMDYSTVGSKFGYRNHPCYHCCKMHNGIDLGAPKGVNIYATEDGVIVVNSYSDTEGNFVVVGHGAMVNGEYEYYTKYLHQVSKSDTIVGEKVQAGQVIGHVGSTGDSTAPHLHFSVFKNYYSGNVIYIDPLEYFKDIADQISFNATSKNFYSAEASCVAAGNPQCYGGEKSTCSK